MKTIVFISLLGILGAACVGAIDDSATDATAEELLLGGSPGIREPAHLEPSTPETTVTALPNIYTIGIVCDVGPRLEASEHERACCVDAGCTLRTEITEELCELEVCDCNTFLDVDLSSADDRAFAECVLGGEEG